MPISRKEMEKRRKRLLKAAFRLFSRKFISSVTFQEIADETGIGVASVYRYFPDKEEFATAVYSFAWTEFITSVSGENQLSASSESPAIEQLDNILDVFVVLHADHKDLLLFTEDYSSFMRKSILEGESQPPYEEIRKLLDDRFHLLYGKALEDQTVRTDISELNLKRDIFDTMLASCIFYAKGEALIGDEQWSYSQSILRLKHILLEYASGRTKSVLNHIEGSL